jgi:hypothetical protein
VNPAGAEVKCRLVRAVLLSASATERARVGSFYVWAEVVLPLPAVDCITCTASPSNSKDSHFGNKQ